MLTVDCKTIPGIEKLGQDVLQESMNLFTGQGQRRSFRGKPTPLYNAEFYKAPIWRDKVEGEEALKNAWNNLAQCLLDLPTSEFYFPEKSAYFNLAAFDQIIKAHVKLDTMPQPARQNFFKIIRHIVSLRLQICVLVEQPPFPFKETSIENSKTLFQTMKQEATPLRDFKSDDPLNKDLFFSKRLGKMAHSAKRGAATKITHPFIKNELMRCGIRVGINPMSVWYAKDTAQRRNLMMVLTQTLERATYESKCSSLTRFSLSTIRGKLVGYVGVSQFDPRVALLILYLLKSKYNHASKTILDTCLGWGERLTAALAYMQMNPEEEIHFTGVDQNPDLKPRYDEIVATLHPENSKSTVKTICSPIQDLPEIGEHDTLITSPPYITGDEPGLVEKYDHLDHQAFDKEAWWNTVMLAILMHGKKDKLPQDGAISVLVINQYMREKLKSTFLNRFDQEVLFEMPYPVAFSKKAYLLKSQTILDTSHEVIIAYRRAVRAPAFIDYPLTVEGKRHTQEEDDRGKRVAADTEESTVANPITTEAIMTGVLENVDSPALQYQESTSGLTFFYNDINNQNQAQALPEVNEEAPNPWEVLLNVSEEAYQTYDSSLV